MATRKRKRKRKSGIPMWLKKLDSRTLEDIAESKKSEFRKPAVVELGKRGIHLVK